MMLSFIRCFKAEFIKKRRSTILYIHIVLPVLCASLFAGYYHISSWQVSAKISAYLEVIAASIPFIIGIIVGGALEIEYNAGGYQILLGTIPSRIASFFGKLIFLLFCFLAAVALALGLFLVLYPVAPFMLYAKALALLFFTTCPLYVLHIFVGMKFGKGATLALGIAGSLLSALMCTGLGDGIWKAIPWAWGIRAMDFTVLSWYDVQYFNQVHSEFANGMIICACSVVCVLSACLLWFRRWDGGKSAE